MAALLHGAVKGKKTDRQWARRMPLPAASTSININFDFFEALTWQLLAGNENTLVGSNVNDCVGNEYSHSTDGVRERERKANLKSDPVANTKTADTSRLVEQQVTRGLTWLRYNPHIFDCIQGKQMRAHTGQKQHPSHVASVSQRSKHKTISQKVMKIKEGKFSVGSNVGPESIRARRNKLLQLYNL